MLKVNAKKKMYKEIGRGLRIKNTVIGKSTYKDRGLHRKLLEIGKWNY